MPSASHRLLLLLTAVACLAGCGADDPPAPGGPASPTGTAAAGAVTSGPATATTATRPVSPATGGGQPGGAAPPTVPGAPAIPPGEHQAGCTELAGVLAETISIQEDLALRPETDYGPRFADLEGRVRAIGDAEVRKAGLDYLGVLRDLVPSTSGATPDASAIDRIGPAIAEVDRLCL